MINQWTPMRWPGGWKDPSAVSLLEGSGIDFLLFEKGDEYELVKARARLEGFKVADREERLSEVTLVKGEWPGVRSSRGGEGDATAGPTGVAWVDSNGWRVRLNAALHPDTAIWVDAPPRVNARVTADSYLIAVADAAAYGGRWIVSLDSQFAAGIAARKPEALDSWKKAAAATSFFASHKSWGDYVPEANIGVVSDFSGQNESLTRELLNLLGRAGLHYRIILKKTPSDFSFNNLKAAIYIDKDPPPAGLRKQILTFVQAGGMLITTAGWGDAAGAPPKSDDHPGYSSRVFGKGKVEVAKVMPNDPFVLANDAAVLMSHRYDLVRFWNGGATGSFYTMAPDRKRALVHLLFYANRGPDAASVRVAGRYRTAKMLTVDRPEPRSVEMVAEKDAVEVHLPAVSQYVGLELEV